MLYLAIPLYPKNHLLHFKTKTTRVCDWHWGQCRWQHWGQCGSTGASAGGAGTGGAGAGGTGGGTGGGGAGCFSHLPFYRLCQVSGDTSLNAGLNYGSVSPPNIHQVHIILLLFFNM